MKKIFFEQILFICGSLITCALILASAQSEFVATVPQSLERQIATLALQAQASFETSSTELLKIALTQMPVRWTEVLNSSLVADWRDRLLNSPIALSANTAVVPFASCIAHKSLFTIQGDMTPLLDLADTQEAEMVRSELNDGPSPEFLTQTNRLARFDLARVLASAHSFERLTDALTTPLDEINAFQQASLVASQSAAPRTSVLATVIVTSSCAPIEPPVQGLPADPLKDVILDFESKEALNHGLDEALVRPQTIASDAR